MLFDVGQNGAAQFGVSASRLTSANDVPDGVLFGQRKRGRYDGQRLHGVVEVDSNRPSVAANVAQHAPLSLSFVVRLKQGSQLVNGVNVGHDGCSPERQHGSQHEGANKGREAHQTNQPAQGIGFGERRYNGERKAEEQADEGPGLQAGFETDTRAFFLGHGDALARRELKAWSNWKTIK